jgi:ankyrin repeat protein
VLTSAGADVNAADRRGSTPLHNAASGGHDAAVRLLAEQGANLEAETQSGQTPLAMTATSTNLSLAAYVTAKDGTSTAELLRALGAVQ